MSNQIPDRLQEIIEDFSFCEGQEKLEYLMELGESLLPLPGWLNDQHQLMVEIKECMSPVFVYLEFNDDNLALHFDVPGTAPMVRGYAAALQQGTVGIRAEEMQMLPNDLFVQMGLPGVLSQQRTNGISAIIPRLKELLRRA